jgi:hypothetical protein
MCVCVCYSERVVAFSPSLLYSSVSLHFPLPLYPFLATFLLSFLSLPSFVSFTFLPYSSSADSTTHPPLQSHPHIQPNPISLTSSLHQSNVGSILDLGLSSSDYVEVPSQPQPALPTPARPNTAFDAQEDFVGTYVTPSNSFYNTFRTASMT